MKLIIDVPEEHYRALQDAMKNHMESLIGKIILNGTPIPDNATNGDVIKAMFPEAKVMLNEKNTISWIYKRMIKTYPLDWWNAPYQKGGKE